MVQWFDQHPGVFFGEGPGSLGLSLEKDPLTAVSLGCLTHTYGCLLPLLLQSEQS